MNLKTKLQHDLALHSDAHPSSRNFGSYDFLSTGFADTNPSDKRGSWVKSALIVGYILVVLLISGLARANGL